MKKYEPQEIEKKWQKYWEDNKTFQTTESGDKQKFYILDMFPYPSGSGLHVGHPKGYIATDVIARMKMMQGFNVLHPMGWDAFGLPAENYAIANKVHPREGTNKNIEIFKKQLGMLGFTYDWDREVNTTDSDYYKWTQWAFIQMFKRGLAYESHEPINWCPSCKTGLANEDLEDGNCERCGTQVEQKPLRQWVLGITKYADRLLEGLDQLPEWEHSIKEMQRHWIGRKEGINIEYDVDNLDEKIICFTTRPDTNFGATFVVVAPESEFVKNNFDKFFDKDEIDKYIEEALKKSDIDRIAEGGQKTGVFTGLYATNHLTGKKMPIYVSDFVLANVGTGAVVGVPGHDLRDFEFAVAKDLEIIRVVIGKDGDASPITKLEQVQEETGVMINSEFLDGMDIHEATEKIMDHIEKNGWGKRVVNYKLRDWVFSRQRYWGEPIPLVKCESCANKKYNYLFVHGYTAQSDSVFWPNLKEKLEGMGNTVCSPDLPNTEEPNIDAQVKYIEDNIDFEIDENTIIVSHSLGGVVTYKLLERLKTKVSKVLLVDPVVTPKFPDKKRPVVEKSCDWNFDWEKIKGLSDEFVILGDMDFGTISENDLRNLKEHLDAKLYLEKPKERHFTGEKEVGVQNMLANTGWFPVPEDQLPLELPNVENYEPSGTGESPLANIDEWVNTECPKCGGPAKRETNTMPQWAGSCWYYLRYEDPHNDKALVDREKEKYWSPVDLYVGGAEHATRHLIYARFWHKFLYDIGVVSNDEPFTKLQHVGLILAEDGRKMSKRWDNVVNPDDIVGEFGADAMRVYEMFMGPFDQPCAWSTKGVVGTKRFLDKVWKLQEKVIEVESENNSLTTLVHQTIKKVGKDIEEMKFNTAISTLMEFTNTLTKEEKISKAGYAVLIKLISPFAPHIAEELWNSLGNKESISTIKWPKYDPELIIDDVITVVAQVNGKVRDEFQVAVDISEEEIKKLVLDSDKVQKWLEGKEPKKVIYVKGKLVSIVV
ncbi:leucine--tRNA ligase [Candidatus Parcubacteria bacterium]|jgi:leucyl-tRNA synthetase/predicted alpha/beta hydrolase family esterase|nr:leucine--tRNA ligase [Candidatus Parcubacteria bacterium]